MLLGTGWIGHDLADPPIPIAAGNLHDGVGKWRDFFPTSVNLGKFRNQLTQTGSITPLAELSVFVNMDTKKLI